LETKRRGEQNENENENENEEEEPGRGKMLVAPGDNQGKK
jgi:hypothetical protein